MQCAPTAGRYRPVGSFINNKPILIAFAGKHRVTFIKNTRKMHLGKLADFLLQTDLHKKLICPTTARNVANEAGKGREPLAQRVLHPTAALQLQTRANCSITQQGCPPGTHRCPWGEGAGLCPTESRRTRDMGPQCSYWLGDGTQLNRGGVKMRR